MRDAVVSKEEGGAAAGLREESIPISIMLPLPPPRPLDLVTGLSTGAATGRTTTTTSQRRLASGRSRESGWSTRKLRHGSQILLETLGEAAQGLKALIEEAPFLHPGPREPREVQEQWLEVRGLQNEE